MNTNNAYKEYKEYLNRTRDAEMWHLYSYHHLLAKEFGLDIKEAEKIVDDWYVNN
jgi:hypothetical protein